MFGIGDDLRDAEWRGVVRQLLAQGLLAVEGDYGTLALTEASGECWRGQRQVLLRREPERGQRAAKASRAAAAAAAAAAELPAGGRGGVRDAAGLAGGDGQGAGHARLRDLP